MNIARLPRVLRAATLLLVLALSACTSSSAPPQAAPLRILGASVVASPAGFSGSCGTSLTFRYTATFTTNAGHRGGAAHYLWRIGYTTVEGDVSFVSGQTIQQVSRAVTATIQPDVEPLLLSSLQTTSPNTVSAPQVIVRLPCAAPLQIVSADLAASPSSAGCGSYTFGFAAILTAPEGNPGGAVQYTWHFLDGSLRQGRVSLEAGQINVTIAVAVTYYVLADAQSAALASSRSAAATRPVRHPPAEPSLVPTPPSDATPTPEATPTPDAAPTPDATHTATPSPTPTIGPLGVPAHAADIGTWLTIDAPNTLQTPPVAPVISC